ncbi:MAG: N-formylglutamate amidohydrolase [Phycisphaerales bacterium]|nr:MAG: N-formylglutamate amidohydrolase [Phycisphaerales bacterium]
MPEAPRPHRPALLLTCEHAGNTVPREFAHLFSGHDATLESHRGWDIGAHALARGMARAAGAPLIAHTITRLLVEVNRSPHHRALFSEFTRGLPKDEKARIVRTHYAPHRERVEREIGAMGRGGRCVVLVGVHSFTPELGGEVRTADIGLLYDPKRALEKSFCHAWRDALRRVDPEQRVRMNYPYRGAADGFTTYLRSRFSPNRFLGIELEVNQRIALDGGEPWRRLQRTLSNTLAETLRSGA